MGLRPEQDFRNLIWIIVCLYLELLPSYYTMKWIFYIVLFCGVFLFFSCTNHNEFDLYGEELCDTTNITWENTIADILDRNCVICHGPVTSYNNVRHDSYEAE